MPTVRGREDVRRYIAQIPAALETKILRGAARAGAKVVADEAKLRSASDGVASAIQTRSQNEGQGRIVVKVSVKKGWWRSVGIWLEYGTSPHFISVDDSQRQGMSVGRINRLVKEQGSSHSMVIGGQFVGDTVFHPGARAEPFLRPALDTKEREAIAAAQSYITTRLAREGLGGADAGDDEQ